jgi:hypothetical protein
MLKPTVDSTSKFFGERCQFGLGRVGNSGELREDYIRWAARARVFPLARTKFMAALKAHPDIQMTTRGGLLRGVDLKANCAQLEQWLTERCERGPQVYQCTLDLWRDFVEWVGGRGGIAPPMWIFAMRLGGIQGLRHTNGLPNNAGHGFYGLKLKSLTSSR